VLLLWVPYGATFFYTPPPPSPDVNKIVHCY
jgi:hypothetical protein